jgi:hypothetical protein
VGDEAPGERCNTFSGRKKYSRFAGVIVFPEVGIDRRAGRRGTGQHAGAVRFEQILTVSRDPEHHQRTPRTKRILLK